MIFSRRAIQRMLNELRTLLPEGDMADFVKRLNRAGSDRLAAVWEVAILRALAVQGEVKHEVQLASGRRPDVMFVGQTNVSFIADITTVSDDGLDDANPINVLADLIEQLKTRLGLPLGGVSLNVREREVVGSRGRRRVLRLPAKARLPEFVRLRIEPELRRQIAEGLSPITLTFDEEDIGFDLGIGPGPYSHFSHGAYSNPTILSSNPLSNALTAKAEQLRGAEGITGVIVTDGSCSALRDRQPGWNEVTTPAIVNDFLRRHRSVDFVLLLSVRETVRTFMSTDRPQRWVSAELIVRKENPLNDAYVTLLQELPRSMPNPMMMPENAYHRARERGWDRAPGGHTMSNKTITIGAREVVEVLAGRMTADEFNSRHRWHGTSTSQDQNTFPNPFEMQLRAGRLPVRMRLLESNEDQSDNWIEIEFGERDPAISSFR